MRSSLATGFLFASFVFAAACGSSNTVDAVAAPTPDNADAGPVSTPDDAAVPTLNPDDASTGPGSAADGGTKGDAAAQDSGPGKTGSTGPYPAFSFDPPTLKSEGGHVLTSPKIVSITFGNDPLADQIDAFITKMPTSTYWAATTSEYGVGALRPSTTVRVATAPATSSDSNIQSFLRQNMGGSLGVFDPQAIYVIFYPATTKISGGTCDTELGYHYEIANGNAGPIVYAVVPQCPMVPEGNGTLIDEVTDVAGHELVEAATDPFPNSDTAWDIVDDLHVAWEMALYGESGDLCVQSEMDPGDRPADLGFFVQRTWSNVSAMANHNPCVPISPTVANGTTYFTAVPVISDMFSVSVSGRHATTKGITLPATIDLHLASDAPMPAWTLSAHDDQEFNGNPAHMTFSFSASTGSNGDVVKLTITPNAGVKSGTGYFVVESKNLATKESNLAPVAFKIP